MRNWITHSVLWIILSIACVGLKAQSDSTRTRIIIQEPGRSLVKEEKTKGLVLKTSVFRWMRGEVPLLVEFPISKTAHIEFGPSITFFDMGFLIWAEGVVFDSYTKVNSYDTYIMSPEGSRVGMGFTAQFKYLFDKDDLFSGTGIGLYSNIRRHKYDFTHGQAVFDPGLVRVRELALMFVNQNHDGGFREINIGLGMNMHKMDYAKYDDSSGTVIYSPATITLIKPAVYWNLKLGLALFMR